MPDYDIWSDFLGHVIWHKTEFDSFFHLLLYMILCIFIFKIPIEMETCFIWICNLWKVSSGNWMWGSLYVKIPKLKFTGVLFVLSVLMIRNKFLLLFGGIRCFLENLVLWYLEYTLVFELIRFVAIQFSIIGFCYFHLWNLNLMLGINLSNQNTCTPM